MPDELSEREQEELYQIWRDVHHGGMLAYVYHYPFLVMSQAERLVRWGDGKVHDGDPIAEMAFVATLATRNFEIVSELVERFPRYIFNLAYTFINSQTRKFGPPDDEDFQQWYAGLSKKAIAQIASKCQDLGHISSLVSAITKTVESTDDLELLMIVMRAQPTHIPYILECARTLSTNKHSWLYTILSERAAREFPDSFKLTKV